MSSSDWLQGLQSLINNLLKPIVKTQAERNKYLDSNAMAVWSTAFTHETYSPGDNYEDLEYLGDAILKSVFPKYLMKRLPHLHKGEYTELNIVYMSKVGQRDFTKKLGLEPFIRVRGLTRANFNIEADVFESFFGALDTVSDMVKPGLGFINCYNMIVDIFKDLYIDESRAKGPAKTQVFQIFVRFGLPRPEQIDKIQKEFAEVTVLLTKQHLDFLKTYGVKITNPVIGYASGPTKESIEPLAYKLALEKLTEYGITSEWAEDAKQARDFSGEDIDSYVPGAMKRLEKEGFVTMLFFVPRKSTGKNEVVQLLGVRPDGKREVLKYILATDSDDGYRGSKVKLVEEYASGQ